MLASLPSHNTANTCVCVLKDWKSCIVKKTLFFGQWISTRCYEYGLIQHIISTRCKRKQQHESILGLHVLMQAMQFPRCAQQPMRSCRYTQRLQRYVFESTNIDVGLCGINT